MENEGLETIYLSQELLRQTENFGDRAIEQVPHADQDRRPFNKGRLGPRRMAQALPRRDPATGRHLFIFEFEMGKWDDREFIEAPRSRFTGWDGAKYNWQSSYEMPMHEAMAWLRLENVWICGTLGTSPQCSR
jgi:hypothetical protein